MKFRWTIEVDANDLMTSAVIEQGLEAFRKEAASRGYTFDVKFENVRVGVQRVDVRPRYHKR